MISPMSRLSSDPLTVHKRVLGFNAVLYSLILTTVYLSAERRVSQLGSITYPGPEPDIGQVIVVSGDG